MSQASRPCAGVPFLGQLTLIAAEFGTPVRAAVPGRVWGEGFFLVLLAPGVYQTVRQGPTIVRCLRDSA